MIDVYGTLPTSRRAPRAPNNGPPVSRRQDQRCQSPAQRVALGRALPHPQPKKTTVRQSDHSVLGIVQLAVHTGG